MEVRHYPMFVSLHGRVCLVVGGGPVGERKIRVLLQYGAAVRLVAEDLTPWLQIQCKERAILLVGTTYAKGYLDHVDLVFAATSDLALNRMIADDAEKRKLWCNMATEPDLGSFIVPSIFHRGPLTLAISTGGASPAVAVLIKQKLEQDFGTEWVILLNLMALLRTSVQAKGLGSVQNQEIYRKVAGLPLLEWIQNREQTRVIQAVADICHPWVTPTELTQIWDEAWNLSS
jgi:precorrin-2 dehydrogenase / sirohydrochlorin ferrochelatase